MRDGTGHTEFTKEEASALVGKAFETIAELAEVPKGVRGLVVTTQRQSKTWLVVIKWEMHNTITAGQGRYQWFTKIEMQQCLREVPA
jgi:hypothetical protein